MNIDKFHNVYFLGIGGIGMSALARYFKYSGKNVSGYDRSPTPLTGMLENEGITIHYEDDIDQVDNIFKNKENTLIIITPAIPAGHNEKKFFEENGFYIVKRAKALGAIINEKKGIAIAGTHGKTTVSTMTSYILKNSAVDCSAFLGGISKNYNTNYLFSENSDFIVAEADEFDRSFLQLKPFIALVTAIDADHLEIYGNKQSIIDSFNEFINGVHSEGILILNSKVKDLLNIPKNMKIYTYSLDDSTNDFYIKNKKLDSGLYRYSLHTPFGTIYDLTLGTHGLVNLENSVAACAAALSAGVIPEEIFKSLPHFSGVKRRFDILYRSEDFIYIDDYAHHPEEIKRFLESVRELFPDKRITGIFQPHLYTRTRDFASEFAASLSLLDKLYLLDIYPARELPIPGVTSEIVFNNVTSPKKVMCNKNNILKMLEEEKTDILLTIGAGDIDSLTGPITNLIKEKIEED